MASQNTSSRRHLLPVRQCKERIVDKIRMNRVTLIFADTGSGKSSQVPQMLLEEGLAPVLCTQPRRLAVVAISKVVAKERGCSLGEEVGFHIGQKKVVTTRSKIVYETAGVFLEELRCEGFKAISEYKVVVLDEVHERSIESDLVLTCMKQFMLRNVNIRLVLMSATADSFRYKEYFNEIERGEKVAIIPIDMGEQQWKMRFQIKVNYLEQVIDLLGKMLKHVAVLDTLRRFSLPYQNGCDMGQETQNLITDLVIHLHNNDCNLNRSILIFLPTYKSLQNQWSLLRSTGLHLRLHVLHSSIDMEHALQALEACQSGRKVILASNVAESSVTLPGVYYVIDSCRSLEVCWDSQRQRDQTRLIWISISQAEQRKGRTGRTCDGVVFRMVPQSVYYRFKKFETPAMQLLSLRKQVLTITCAESKAVNDPIALFPKAMDPPIQDTVQNALVELQNIGAVSGPSNKGKHLPTMYGKLLANMPLSLEAAIFVAKGGQLGMLREAAILAVLMERTPYPILQPFGQQNLYDKYLDRYYKGDHSFRVVLANLIAFGFWQRTYKDEQRLERLLSHAGTFRGTSETSISCMGRMESEWCAHHHLLESALQSIADTYASIIENLHRFRPKFLQQLRGPPPYYCAYEFEHTCNLLPEMDQNKASIMKEDQLDSEADSVVCRMEQFVTTGKFLSLEDEKKLKNLLEKYSWHSNYRRAHGSVNYRECAKGPSPDKLVSPNPELWRFLLNANSCGNGETCRLSHSQNDHALISHTGSPEFEEDCCSGESLLSILSFSRSYDEGINREASNPEFILLFGEEDFMFTESMSRYYTPTKMIATSALSRQDALAKRSTNLANRIIKLSEAGVQIFWSIDAATLALKDASCIPWRKIQSVLWTINMSTEDKGTEIERIHFWKFFASLCIIFLTEGLADVKVLLTMYNSSYARWQVEAAARDCFFFLSQSEPFNVHKFGCYNTKGRNDEFLFGQAKPVSYVFKFWPPSEVLHGDYFSRFERALRS